MCEKPGILFICLLALFPAGCKQTGHEEKSLNQLLSSIQLPGPDDADLKLAKSWVFENSEPIAADYLYITGGIDNIDKGSIDWGTTDSRKFRMIGDYAGELRISYDNEMTDVIPLVFGYTLWFKHGWLEGKEPFQSDTAARELLDSTLYLSHIDNPGQGYILRIRLRNAGVKRIDYFDNLLKDGQVQFSAFQLSGIDPENPLPDLFSRFNDNQAEAAFYASHTIDTLDSYPAFIRQNLKRMMYLLYSFNFDAEGVTSVSVPEGYKGPVVGFSGTAEANIISSVFLHNLHDQVSRADTNGIVHESAWKSPSWFYDGFGTWTNAIGEGNNGSYWDCYYTRNKTIMILPDLNYLDQSNRALALLDRQLMFFPDGYPGLQLGGKKIPGHWTVIANKPLIYSKVLTGVGWPTQYTAKKFGSHFSDFGNPETDGHGHSMMSHWKTWQNSGREKKWVLDRWAYLKEAADYLLWSIDNPDLSFSQHGLLYAESEAAMNDFSLYCNYPCYLGLLMYAEMADSADHRDDATRWRNAARQLKSSMEAYFAADDSVYGRIWRKVGFYHENILSTLKEYAGFDLKGQLPEEWFQRSLHTYLKEKDSMADFYGPIGLGYDHGIVSQTALLLDRMDDATTWMTHLAHLCYAPRLPNPYIVPECASVDVKRGIIRRQGDVGNGYQQAETVNTILLCAGIDDNTPGVLRIMPRLPDHWHMKVSKYPVVVYAGKSCHTSLISLQVTWPEKGEQTLELTVTTGGDLKNVQFRLGPFDAGTASVYISINGAAMKEYQTVSRGDRTWAWVSLGNIPLHEKVILRTRK